MATMTIRMDDADAELAKRFAALEGKSLSDFARDAILAKIEDYEDLQELRDAVSSDTGKRYNQKSIIAELDL